MNIDWDVVRKNISFFVSLFRPSLAKALSLPLLLSGLSIVNPPFCLTIVNWILSNFSSKPIESITMPPENVGWILICLSFLIFLVDVWRQVKSERYDSETSSEQTASKVVEKIRGNGFTAQHLQDERIGKLVQEIALLRFFDSFPTEEKATTLAESIIDGELSGGTAQAKAQALALLARYLCISKSVDQVKTWLSTSQKMCRTEEAEIALAFVEAIDLKDVNAASCLLKAKSPAGYSAFLMVNRAVNGSVSALSWFESAGLSTKDLDTDGRIALVAALLSECHWEKALAFVDTLGNESVSMSPALAQLSAFTCLVNAVKVAEARNIALRGVPFAAGRFPLADDDKSLALRNRSVEMFKVCSNLARHNGAQDIANTADRYVLWLELRNKEKHEQALAQLKSYFVSYTQKTIEYLPLAFDFGIDIDFESIEREVNRQTALSPIFDPVLGGARFILAAAKESPKQTVDYVNKHRRQMEGTVGPTLIGMLEIAALARSGLVDDAELLLTKLLDLGIPADEVRKLQNIIDTAKGEDPIALAIAQFQNSNAINDLTFLVNLLEREKLWEKHYTYCRELFERTGQESDAIGVCDSASLLGKFSDLHQFLSERMDIVRKSDRLQMHWAWSLFRKGDLSGAREQIASLKQSIPQDPNLKALEINLSIYSGDWEYLSSIVEDSWSRRENLKAEGLLQAAWLAKAVSPKRVRQILEFCTVQYPNDPKVLASSYFTATTMGLEENQEISGWLQQAIAVSSEDGPLRRASFEDLKEMMAESREKNELVYRAYQNGEAPIFIVATALNRSMSDFYLIQPIENEKTKDIRRKYLVPIFHGARLEQVIVGKMIACDASSALVLENIGLLSYLFNCFERIVIPHSFMRWLFEEKQKVAFHQPSQIEKAKYFERLVSEDSIITFHPNKINNPELALDVGDELAYMLEEASANPTNESQALVVCSNPVYKVRGSFREAEADLSPFYHCLISCSQLVKKLKDLALITDAECFMALNYLRQQEKEWPTDLEVASGTKLFLDSLSITYFITVDMLDKLSEAGFKVYVNRSERDKYRALINYDLSSTQAENKIENIRRFFFDGLASGKVALAEMPLYKEGVAASRGQDAVPTLDIFEAIKVSEAALIDDRFINQNSSIESDEKSVPIFTSIDFLETLYHRGMISKEKKFDLRTELREMGFEFVGISYEELEYHLNSSTNGHGDFVPTKQLRQLRESFLLIRISGLIQLPRDAQWLQRTMKVIAKAIRAQWSQDIPPELKGARSCWLYELMGYREWAQAHQIRSVGGMAYLGELLKVSSMLIPLESVSDEQKEAYNAWLDKFVLAPLKDIDPWSFKGVIDSMKQQVKDIPQQLIIGKESNG